MASPPNVRLALLNRPENVVLVREALSGLAEALAIDGGDLSDIRTAVTEACNNVVMHAYAGAEGPLEVEIAIANDALEVVVRDRGIGLDQPREPAADSTPGIGLPVIEALAREVAFGEGADGVGAEVRMLLAAAQQRPLADRGERVAKGEVTTADPDLGAVAIAVAVAPPSLARTILPRLACVLAARAQFSTDRISDAQLVADALAAHAAHASGTADGDSFAVAIGAHDGVLHVRVGPLLAGRAERLVLDSDVAGLGPVLGKLTDGHEVLASANGEKLALRMLDRADATSRP